MLNKITNNSNKTTMRFQVIQDNYNVIFNVNFIIVIDIYTFLKNFVKFASKLI